LATAVAPAVITSAPAAAAAKIFWDFFTVVLLGWAASGRLGMSGPASGDVRRSQAAAFPWWNWAGRGRISPSVGAGWSFWLAVSAKWLRDQ
jgi:hypothetical protein